MDPMLSPRKRSMIGPIHRAIGDEMALGLVAEVSTANVSDRRARDGAPDLRTVRMTDLRTANGLGGAAVGGHSHLPLMERHGLALLRDLGGSAHRFHRVATTPHADDARSGAYDRTCGAALEKSTDGPDRELGEVPEDARITPVAHADVVTPVWHGVS